MCKSINLPKGTYKLECWGAQGGISSSANNGKSAPPGGYSSGILKLQTNTVLYFYIGGKGNTTLIGGWNGGGGYSVSDSSYQNTGGGGTDISLRGKHNSTTFDTVNHWYSRIIVAGGGGGTEAWGSCVDGYGGGLSGGGEYPGTQISTSGGGTFGKGGAGTRTGSNPNGGGGGGWYGGGACTEAKYVSPGGGSGYVYTSSTASNYPSGCLLNSNYYLVNAQTIAGNTSFTSPTGTTETGHSGNGYARITVIEAKNNLSIYIKNNTWKENNKILFKKTNWINHKNIYIKYNPQSLPTGYTALEYIQSSGTQYINTGVVPSENTKMQIKFSTSTSKGVIAGSDKGYKVSSFMLAVTIATFNTGSLAVSLADGSKHSVKLYSNNVIIDNSNKGSGGSGSFTTTYPIYLFGNNRSGSSSELISGKIYSCSLYNSTTKIRNFIPAKNSSNILGLYDTINKKFYTNAGTGAFTAGPIATASWIKIENL